MALITKLSQHEQLYLIKTAPHTLRRQMIKCCLLRHQTARRYSLLELNCALKSGTAKQLQYFTT